MKDNKARINSQVEDAYKGQTEAIASHYLDLNSTEKKQVDAAVKTLLSGHPKLQDNIELQNLVRGHIALNYQNSKAETVEKYLYHLTPDGKKTNLTTINMKVDEWAKII